jgi:hypothetical protein
MKGMISSGQVSITNLADNQFCFTSKPLMKIRYQSFQVHSLKKIVTREGHLWDLGPRHKKQLSLNVQDADSY